MAKLYTTQEVADELGVTDRRVRALAKSREVGKRIGARMLVFTASDLDKMRDRKPGPRPKTTKTRRTAAGKM
jgi:hypothetical protein